MCHPLLKIDKQSTINQQLRPRHIPTQLLTGEKHRRPSHIARYARPTERNPALHVLPLRVVLQVLVVQLRLDRPRQQRVAADPVLAQRHRRALHQAQHPGLGRRVVRLQPAADERRDGRDADDRPARRLLRRHLPRRRLHHVEGPVQVHPHRAREQVRLHGQELGELAHPGVRHADVEPPPELGHRVLDQLGPRAGIRHVAREVVECACGGVARFNARCLGHQGLEVFFVLGQVQVVDHYIGALPHVLQCDGPPDTSAAAGYDGSLADKEIGYWHICNLRFSLIS
ncbi:hypothetical protein SUNI508_00802 [Seiridium unicorne]|uniref:Uncharacterized protein n=1 Tax=Seiridium unicorne TaxID=138068 RepID=A0ABR2V201_9PEZI